MKVGVKEAITVEHANDGRGADVDDPIALLWAQGLHGRIVWWQTWQELHHQQTLCRELAVDLREDDFGLVANHNQLQRKKAVSGGKQ